MVILQRLALGLLVASLAMATTAFAAPNDDLTGLTNREYVDYARDRFEWLTGEARSSHRLASKFHKECKPAGASEGDADAARACEIAKAADAQSEQIQKEGRDLMAGLQQRLGGVPPWAQTADNLLQAAAHRQ